jgi:hypothetical protein
VVFGDKRRDGKRRDRSDNWETRERRGKGDGGQVKLFLIKNNVSSFPSTTGTVVPQEPQARAERTQSPAAKLITDF